jgi:hypothetical protein
LHSQQAFTAGQTDVPNNPKYFSRTVVTSVAGAGNHTEKEQTIEDVTKLSGETMTLSFWAKADSAKNIAVEFLQYFGTGGSPSANVEGIGVTTVNLTTEWAKHTVTVEIPSVSGKTIGTNNDHYTRLTIWFEAGSSLDSRTNSLGQQSGTFDIANIQLEKGDTATDFEYIDEATQLARCQRYYERWTSDDAIFGFLTTGYHQTTTQVSGTMRFVEKRAVPSLAVSGNTHLRVDRAGGGVNSTSVALSTPTKYSFNYSIIVPAGTAGQGCNILFAGATGYWVEADAEL